MSDTDRCEFATPARHSAENRHFVVPVDAGNQEYEARNRLDPGVHRGDEMREPRTTNGGPQPLSPPAIRVKTGIKEYELPRGSLFEPRTTSRGVLAGGVHAFQRMLPLEQARVGR